MNSCSNNCFQAAFVRKPEIDAARYQQITIGDITDETGAIADNSNDISDPFYYSLSILKLFNVYDKEYIRNLLIGEQDITPVSVLDSSLLMTVHKKIGRFLYISGRILKNEYNETSEQPQQAFQDRTRSLIVYHRKGIYQLAIEFSFFDSRDLKQIFRKTITESAKDEITEFDKEPRPIDEQALYQQCISKMKDSIIALLIPSTESIEVCFEGDGELPEWDDIANQLKSGNWAAAAEQSKLLLIKNGISLEARAKAYYNFGLIQLHNGNANEASENFKVAMLISPDNEKYRLTYEDAMKAKEELRTAVKN